MKEPIDNHSKDSDSNVREELKARLVALGLKRIAQILDEYLSRAQKTKPSFSRFLLGLADEELVARIDRATDNRIKQSGLPDRPTLENFDFSFQPSLDKRVILELGELGCFGDGSNIIFSGKTGTGKTHLGKALLLRALIRGKTGLFIDAQDLVDRLFESQADRSTQRLLKRWARLDIMLVDELGYLSLEPSQPNQLFRLLGMRYERHLPTIITSNLQPDELVARLGAPAVAAALKDRLMHRCQHIHIDGPSYRDAQGKRRRSTKTPDPGDKS
jgi:DNA replication protein DnaC